jgi:hypothetical protein
LALLALAAVYLAWYRGEMEWAFWQRPFLVFSALLGVSALLLWGRWRGLLRASWFAGLALALVFLDLLAAGHDYNTLSPVSEMFGETETAVFLHSLPDTSRITSLAEGIAYRPNTALAASVPALSGYGPGISQRLVDYLQLAEGGEVIRFGRVLLPLQAAASPLLDVVGVSHIVTTQDRWGDEAVAVGTQADVADLDWQVLLGEWTRPLFVDSAGLFQVDVPLRAAPSVQGRITLRLFTADGDQELANHTVSTDDVADNGWTSFFFAPFPPDWGDEFLAVLHFDGTGEVTVGSDVTGEWTYAAFVRSRPGLVHESGRTRVYANEGDLGRVFVVAAAQVANSPEAALTAVQANAAKLGQVVVLELKDQPEPPVISQPVPMAGEATIVEASLNQVTLRAEMRAPGFVVLADAYDPGWQATVDGRPTPVYRANTVVRAVYVPEGSHETLSGLALLGMLFLVVWRRKRP